MITSAKRDRTAARLRVKLATGLSGLAIAGAIVAACSTASAGAAATKPVPGQYRLPDSAAPAANAGSEPGQYRLPDSAAPAANAGSAAGQYRLPDSAAPVAKPAPGTYSTYPGDSRKSLRFEDLAR